METLVEQLKEGDIQSIREYLALPRAFLFTGQSGSGKETQSKGFKAFIEHKKIIGKSVPRIVTGDLFRDWIKNGKDTYTKRRVEEINEEGGIQSPLLATRLWLNALIEEYTGVGPVILDGTPRSPLEAVLVADAFSPRLYNFGSSVIIICNVKDKVAEKRLVEREKNEKRAETANIEVIRKKLAWYHTDVVPAINFLKTKDGFRVIELDGEKKIDEVFEEMILKIF